MGEKQGPNPGESSARESESKKFKDVLKELWVQMDKFIDDDPNAKEYDMREGVMRLPEHGGLTDESSKWRRTTDVTTLGEVAATGTKRFLMMYRNTLEFAMVVGNGYVLEMDIVTAGLAEDPMFGDYESVIYGFLANETVMMEPQGRDIEGSRRESLTSLCGQEELDKLQAILMTVEADLQAGVLTYE